jgi:hypothetical protein
MDKDYCENCKYLVSLLGTEHEICVLVYLDCLF